MSKPSILITGATGTVGRALVRQLRDTGLPVRALVRDMEKGRRLGADVDIVFGDLSDSATLDAAFAGIEKAFVIANGLNLPALEGNAFEAAKRAGVRHVFKLSGRHLDAPFMAGTDLARFHNSAESMLRSLGTRWTILRPAIFASNFPLWLTPDGDAFVLPADGPDTFIDPRDIAAVAAHLLTMPGHDGVCYELTGPAFMRYSEGVAKIAARSGRNLALQIVPEDAVLKGMTDAGVPRSQAEGLLRYFDGVRKGLIYGPTSTVAEILGRPARSFDDWLADNLDAFQKPSIRVLESP